MKVRVKREGQTADRLWHQKGEILTLPKSEYRDWMEPLDKESREAALELIVKAKNVHIEKQKAIVEREQEILEQLIERQSPDEVKLRRALEEPEL